MHNILENLNWNKLSSMMHDGMVDQYYRNYIHANS